MNTCHVGEVHFYLVFDWYKLFNKKLCNFVMMVCMCENMRSVHQSDLSWIPSLDMRGTCLTMPTALCLPADLSGWTDSLHYQLLLPPLLQSDGTAVLRWHPGPLPHYHAWALRLPSGPVSSGCIPVLTGWLLLHYHRNLVLHHLLVLCTSHASNHKAKAVH